MDIMECMERTLSIGGPEKSTGLPKNISVALVSPPECFLVGITQEHALHGWIIPGRLLRQKGGARPRVPKIDYIG